MKTKKPAPSSRAKHRLICPECGHHHRFIQVMAGEVHLVDGNFNYIRLLETIVDHYIYGECAASFEVNEAVNS